MQRACIVGGSLAGLFAANFLHRAGWAVQVFERSGHELASRGAGIVTHPELLEALRQCGVDPNQGLGVWVEGRVVLNASGTVQAECHLPQLLTSWGRMYRVLRDALPEHAYQHGVNVISVEPESGRYHASQGQTQIDQQADLIVVADGIRSGIRAQLAPQEQPTYAGYIAWRGLVDEAKLSKATHHALFEKFGFCLPEGEQMLGYPVAGPSDTLSAGQRRYNFVWYRPADEERALRQLLTDDDGVYHAHNIAPHRIRTEAIASMRAAAQDKLAPQFAEIVARTEQPFVQPIYDLVSSRLVYQHVVILGDAAFVARPHVGMGVTKAAEDALCLVRALQNERNLSHALASFEQQRLAAGLAVVERARHLGAYMQAQILSTEQRLMATRYRTAEAVMLETALTAHAAAGLRQSQNA